MIEAVSCGGIVIFRGKILVLYKNYRNKYEGWVLPKGTVEDGETYEETAAREVLEEGGSNVKIRKYIGQTEYSFNTSRDEVDKKVHWFLCEADSYNCKPQKEEFFEDAGFYKYHEAIHLVKFPNEKEILKEAYDAYIAMKKANQW